MRTKPERNTYAIGALKRKYAALAGELLGSQGEARRIGASMAHVAATLRLFCADDPKAIKPTAPPVRCRTANTPARLWTCCEPPASP